LRRDLALTRITRIMAGGPNFKRAAGTGAGPWPALQVLRMAVANVFGVLDWSSQ